MSVKGSRPGIRPGQAAKDRRELTGDLAELRDRLTRLRDTLRAATASEHTESGHA